MLTDYVNQRNCFKVKRLVLLCPIKIWLKAGSERLYVVLFMLARFLAIIHNRFMQFYSFSYLQEVTLRPLLP